MLVDDKTDRRDCCTICLNVDSIFYIEELSNMWFWTATNLNWRRFLTRNEYKQIVVESLSYMVQQKRIEVYGFVIMPNHIHLLLKVSSDSKHLFQRDFMKFTAQKIILKMKDLNDPNYWTINSSQADRIRQIWERRSRWIPVAGSRIFYQKLRYIHNNPVQKHWRLVEFPEEYHWSSCKSYLQLESMFDFLSLYED